MNLSNLVNNISGGTWITIIVILLLVLLVGWVIRVYNKLVRAEIDIEEAWSNIDTFLKRRFDLIPNLVETVKGYASHEKSTLEGVIEARSKAGQMNIDIKNITPEQMVNFQSSQGELTSMLGKLFALAEAYPELKANQNFINLQKELKETEDGINKARRFYNGVVEVLNNLVRQVPSNFVAMVFGFKTKPFFEANDEEKKTPEVKF